MKLLIVSHTCATSTNQSFFAEVEAETGWPMTLVIPSRWKTAYGEMESQRWPGLHGSLRRLNVFFPGDIPRHIYKSWFISLLREEKPDVIYVHHEPYGFATLQVYLANAVSTRRPIGFYTCQNIRKDYPTPIRQLEQWVFRTSRFAVPITQGALDVLRAKDYRNDAEVLPLPIDLNLYRPSRAEAADLRRELGIAPERIILGYVGRLVEEKGLGTLIAALEQIRDLPWELVLIGDGPWEPELRRRVAQLAGQAERVHFIGYVPHVQAPRWLNLLDVLVLPSLTRPNWKEQFGRVLAEALACGTPVIGSSSGEIPNVIAATGGGLVFAENDASAFAQAMRQMIVSPELRSECARKGQEAVSRLYDQKALVRRFAAMMERAAASR